LHSLLKDINNDNSLSFEEKDGQYIFTTAVNYPNNRTLINQKIYMDKNLNLKQVDVLNESGNVEIKMTFTNIDKKPTFNDDYFTVKKNIETANIDEEVNTVTNIEDTIFPMFLPENTTLKSQDTITKDDGERIILTFGGDKPFILIEETVSVGDELEIIPTLGEPTLLVDTVGALSEDSVSWISRGMQYYMTSESLTQEELLTIAKSISTIPVMK